MTSIDLRAIENTTKRKHKGQLYWAIQELTHTSKEADAICRDHEIYADAKLEKDRALLMAKLGPCMDDWLLARLCRREVPLVVGALALIGLWRCNISRVDVPAAPSTGSPKSYAPVTSVKRPAVLGLMISSGKLGSYLKRVGAVTPDEVLKLLNIATWFRCMSQEECQHLIPNIELRNDFSLDKEEDILVRLEIDDGADLIGLHDRYELKNRLKEYKRSATIKHLGAIGNLSKLSGFRS